MQPRRSLRMMAGALVLAVPLLGSCGFDKATDQVYTPGAGTNHHADTVSGTVDVLSAVIVAAQDGSGTLVASLSNSSGEEATLSGVTGMVGEAELTVEPSTISVDIPARGLVNLANEEPIVLSGDDLGAGNFTRLTFSFASGNDVTMNVPVVFACDAYEGLDQSAGEDAGEQYECNPHGEDAH